VCSPAGGDPAAAEKPRVIDILRQQRDAWLAGHCPDHAQAKLLHDLQLCRTSALGGHLYVCPKCGHEQPSYNSCRNRNCPNCQAIAQARWVADRELVLLPVGHFHVVFTLPAEFRPLARRHPAATYDLLFDAARQTLTTLAAQELDGHLGVTAVLHTWTRDLLVHPHVHCMVTGGVLQRDLLTFTRRPKYLFPVALLKAFFRARILSGLERLRGRGILSATEHAELVTSLPAEKKWVIYLEAPFSNKTHIVKYLGRYTHRIAISDARIVSVDAAYIHFVTRNGNVTCLSHATFIERFMWHVLPPGFRKIRHYGLYAPGASRTRLNVARALLTPKPQPTTRTGDEPEQCAEPPCREPWDELIIRLTGKDPLECPKCHNARMIAYLLLPVPRATGPPTRTV
jgi:hypothetical protein